MEKVAVLLTYVTVCGAVKENLGAYLGAWDHMGTVQIQGHIMTSTCEEMGALQMGHVLGLNRRRKQLLHT